MTTLILIAKETVAGRVKTRLHPPLSLEQAAQLAAALVQDTLAAVAPLPATRRILLFDGVTPPPGTGGWEVVPQVAGDLDERLAAIFDACSGPTVLIGMDTPQLTAAHLAPAFPVDRFGAAAPWPSGVDAVFGPAVDGGFWAIGMREPRGDLIRGVAMSRDDTGLVQLDRLTGAGLTVQLLPTLIDVDTISDARAVAAIAPATTFAERLASFEAARLVGSR